MDCVGDPTLGQVTGIGEVDKVIYVNHQVQAAILGGDLPVNPALVFFIAAG
jgi:hypothetical protein